MPRVPYIVLRTVPRGEASLIVSGVSPSGRLDFSARGARASGPKKFPCVSLFRLLAVEYAEPLHGKLCSMRGCELLKSFDSLASKTENYLAACRYGEFLLSRCKPGLECPRTFDSAAVFFGRLAEGAPAEPAGTAARLVLLQECGVVPEPETPRGKEVLKAILDFAAGQGAFPQIEDAYFERIRKWQKRLEAFLV